MISVLFSHHIFTRQNYGGISRYIHDLASALDALKETNISVIGGFHRNEFLKKQDNFVLHNYKVPAPFQITTRALEPISEVLYQIHKVRKNPNIEHLSYYPKYLEPTRRAKRVITVHDMLHETHPEFFQNPHATQKLKKNAALSADHVICTSEFTKQQLILAYGLNEEKVSVVYHGAKTHIVDSQTLDRASRLGRFFLYVGSRKTYKNFQTLLLAFKQSNLEKYGLKIVIFGGGELTNHEIAMIDSFNIKKSSIFHAGDNDGQLPALFRTATALVWPSFHEGFGLPPVEAMANECPVISSSSSCMPEILDQAPIYFRPENPKELCAAMTEIVFDSDVRKKIISKGKCRASMFTWDRAATQTANIYRKVLV